MTKQVSKSIAYLNNRPYFNWCIGNLEYIRILFSIDELKEYDANKFFPGFYQTTARFYLDEYPKQKEMRKEFFNKRWNLQNEYLKKVA